MNSSSFALGDFLCFQGDQTFAGNVTFTSNDGGNATNRFTVSSYGTGVATILGQMVGAYYVANVKAFSVPELSKGNYIAVYSDGKVMKTEKMNVVK